MQLGMPYKFLFHSMTSQVHILLQKYAGGFNKSFKVAHVVWEIKVYTSPVYDNF